MRNRRTLRRRTGGHGRGLASEDPGRRGEPHRAPAAARRRSSRCPASCASRSARSSGAGRCGRSPRLRTRRVETPLRDADGRTLALIAQDRVTAETDGREQELAGGRGRAGRRRRRAAQGGRAPAARGRRHAAAGPSKLARALGDRLPPALPRARPRSRATPFSGTCRSSATHLGRFDPGVRRGRPEAVHKMRVATRRLRSTLKTFKRTFPRTAAVARDELKWLAGLLGEVRDGQVLEHKLLAGVEQAGPDFAPAADRIREHLDAQVEHGRAALDEALDSERYLAPAGPDRRADRRPRPGRATTRSSGPARTCARRTRLLDEALADGVDAELHEARKAYKRARYAVEVFAPYGRQAGQTLVKRAHRPAGRARRTTRTRWSPGRCCTTVPRRRTTLPVRHPVRPPGAGRPGHVRAICRRSSRRRRKRALRNWLA